MQRVPAAGHNRVVMRISDLRAAAVGRLRACLVQGISPRRLAFTVSIGFVLGCIPVVGVPTALCVVLALVLRLNQPAIQAANYAAMPFQVALIIPFARLGGKLTPAGWQPALNLTTLASALIHSPARMMLHSSASFLGQLGLFALQALVAWLLLAIPVVLLLTLALTKVFRRVPALATVPTAD
ncbi:DUF2062 domain-containing protein [Acidobacteria bacterium AB60]|nr:DUF2062 domain-containing protein [Acidobacteria bacterium AB60]